MVNEVVGYRCVEDGGGVELFARDGGTDDGEDTRPDDSTDAEGGERDGPKGFLECGLRSFGLVNELVDGLGSEDLSGQGSFLVNGDALDCNDCNWWVNFW